jgi:lysophospholipase L1-like esterase
MHHTRSSKHSLILSLLSLVALLGMLTLSISLQQHQSKAHAAGAGVASDGLPFHLVGPKQHYLALGDSLAYGLQPNCLTTPPCTHGYVNDLFQTLQNEGTKDVTNYGCPGETSSTFINGGCPYAPQGAPAQLAAAVAFLQQNAGKVSPVTLDIGANDILPDLSTCAVDVNKFNADLTTLDTNLTRTILPAVQGALSVNGRVTGDIVMMNYYDPFQNPCPNTVSFVQTLNQHLATDVKGFGIIVDVFTAFGGPGVPNTSLCAYTWMCAATPDIHPTSNGYQVIANTFAAAIPTD